MNHKPTARKQPRLEGLAYNMLKKSVEETKLPYNLIQKSPTRDTCTFLDKISTRGWVTIKS